MTLATSLAPGGPPKRRGVLCGARGAVLLLLRAAACELELREKDAGATNHLPCRFGDEVTHAEIARRAWHLKGNTP